MASVPIEAHGERGGPGAHDSEVNGCGQAETGAAGVREVCVSSMPEVAGGPCMAGA